MPPIIVPSSKRIATQMLVTEKLNERKDFVLRGFVCDIICPSKKLPVHVPARNYLSMSQQETTYPKSATRAPEQGAKTVED